MSKSAQVHEVANSFFSTEWELITVYFCFSLGILTLLLETFSYKGTGEALNEFVSVFQQNPCIRPLRESVVYRKVWWRVVILNFMTLPILLFKFLYFFLYFMKDESPTTDLSLFLAVVDDIYSYLVYLLPSTSGNLEPLSQSTGVFKMAFI